MKEVAQEEISMIVKRDSGVTISPQMLEKVKNFQQSIKRCCELAPVNDNVLQLELQIDKGHWSRMMSGQANFPAEKLNDLMACCGNEFPLLWLAYSEGYGVVKLKTELERENECLKQKNEQLHHDIQIIKNFMKEVKAS